MDLETLEYSLKEGVATVTMNRPERRNAVNRKMFQELESVFAHIGSDRQVRSFVLTGKGDHFCSGADLSIIEEAPTSKEQALERMREIHRILKTIVYCPKPGVAAVRGYAAGGGANLALACDIVVMAEDAKFAELFVKRGLVVDMSGTFTLPRAVGLHRAKELSLLGDPIDARRAYEMGIANRVVAPDEVAGTARELAEKLAAGPPQAMSMIKVALNDSFSKHFDEVLEQESTHQSELFSTKDLAEAITAFFEKRTPKFTGE